MSASRNKRLAWIAQELAKGKSNAAIVLDCMTVFPGCSESVARKDLKEILQRLTEIEMECLPEVKTRMMEVAWKLLEECRSLAQMGPAVNLFKTLAAMQGLMVDPSKSQDSGLASAQPAPESAVVRERIAQLMKSKKIREEAEKAEIDLDKLKNDD